MPSRAHFLFKTGENPLSTLMRRLLSGYVVNLNHKERRLCQSSLTGQAWAAFPKPLQVHNVSEIKDISQNFFLIFILIPLRRKIVTLAAELNSYKYSVHSVLMGIEKRPWQNTEYVLSCFGSKKRCVS